MALTGPLLKANDAQKVCQLAITSVGAVSPFNYLTNQLINLPIGGRLC